MKKIIEKLTKQYEDCPLECDGLTRVLHTVLENNDIPHKVMMGNVVHKDHKIPLHFWIVLEDDSIFDYRLRMWFGDKAPHGIFKNTNGFKYNGEEVRMNILDEWLFNIMINKIDYENI